MIMKEIIKNLLETQFIFLKYCFLIFILKVIKNDERRLNRHCICCIYIYVYKKKRKMQQN